MRAVWVCEYNIFMWLDKGKVSICCTRTTQGCTKGREAVVNGQPPFVRPEDFPRIAVRRNHSSQVHLGNRLPRWRPRSNEGTRLSRRRHQEHILRESDEGQAKAPRSTAPCSSSRTQRWRRYHCKLGEACPRLSPLYSLSFMLTGAA